MKTPASKKALLILWVLIVLFLSLYPFKANETKHFWEHTDKVVHFIMYLVLSVLTINALDDKKTYAIALIISVLFGIIIEVLQELMQLGRTFSIMDILANFMGVCTGLTGYYFMKKYKLKSA